MAVVSGRTIWVLGDQLNRTLGALARRRPRRRPHPAGREPTPSWRRSGGTANALHLVLSAMRRFAAELRGRRVRGRPPARRRRCGRDCRAPSRVPAGRGGGDGAGLVGRPGDARGRRRRRWCGPTSSSATPTSSPTGRRPKTSLRMEDFYRWQRRRLGYLMDGDEPAGGRWNFDDREPGATAKATARAWPEPLRQPTGRHRPDVVADRDPPRVGRAARRHVADDSRAEALARLRHVVDEVLPRFGPHEDAMLDDELAPRPHPAVGRR